MVYSKEHILKIRLAEAIDEQELIQLIAKFRQSLAQLRGKVSNMDLASAKKELSGYQEREFPIYVAESDAERVIGYLVCRVDENVVWAESLFVSAEYRRQGIGTSLYAEAEHLAQELGKDTPYNWVDPNNTAIIRFLQKRGYSVLNLIELRRTRSGEKMTNKICVGTNEFDYY